MNIYKNTRIKVLMLGWEYPPFISGGLGTACKGIIDGLAATGGVDVTLTLPKAYPRASKLVFPRIVSFSPLAQFNKLYDSSYNYRIHLVVEDYAGKVERFARTESFDVIHAHDWLTGVAGRRIKYLTGTPLVLHIHSTELDRGGSGGDLVVWGLEKLAMDAADVIVAVSHYTKNLICRRYHQDPKKIQVIHNAVSKLEDPVLKRKRGGLITFAGRVTSQKGPEYFVRAAQLTLRRQPALKFVLAGEGDQLDSMKKLSHYLGISSNFFFPGFLQSEDLHQLLCRSQLAVLPSLSEPFGILALEAVQAGVPVVISKSFGAAEVLPSLDQTHYWDTQAISELMLKVSCDSDYAARKICLAQQELSSVSWESSAERLIGIYRDLVFQSEFATVRLLGRSKSVPNCEVKTPMSD